MFVFEGFSSPFSSFHFPLRQLLIQQKNDLVCDEKATVPAIPLHG